MHLRTLASLLTLALILAGCSAGSPVETEAVGPTAATEPASTEAPADDDHAEDDHATEETEHQEDDGHDEAEPTDEIEGRVVNVVLTEFAIEMDSTTFAAGETVTFVVSNEGAIEHEFRLSNSHRIEEHMESGHEGHGDEEEGHHEGEVDMYVHLEAGEMGNLVVTFPHDMEIFTEAACLVPGHYEADMRIGIDVQV